MDEIKQLINELQQKKFKPVYFLMGEEPYYIDKLSEYIEENVLDESQRGFDQLLLYGKDVSMSDVVANAKKYPMIAPLQVIIVKEAQYLKKDLDSLEAYIENPQPTTLLVFCYKYATIDKRTKLYKQLGKVGVVFESKKLYENQIADWIRRLLSGRGYGIQPKAAQLLVDYLGNDLSKISNELDKLAIILPKGTEITALHIEENIGISKDFNNFELRKALAEKDTVKAYRIINYFAQNPKDNPLVVTVNSLFSFFSQLLQYHGLADHSKQNVASALKINPYFVGEYQTAAKNYTMKKASEAIALLREMDVKGKGVNSHASQHDLLKEFLVKVL